MKNENEQPGLTAIFSAHPQCADCGGDTDRILKEARKKSHRVILAGWLCFIVSMFGSGWSYYVADQKMSEAEWHQVAVRDHLHRIGKGAIEEFTNGNLSGKWTVQYRDDIAWEWQWFGAGTWAGYPEPGRWACADWAFGQSTLDFALGETPDNRQMCLDAIFDDAMRSHERLEDLLGSADVVWSVGHDGEQMRCVTSDPDRPCRLVWSATKDPVVPKMLTLPTWAMEVAE